MDGGCCRCVQSGSIGKREGVQGTTDANYRCADGVFPVKSPLIVLAQRGSISSEGVCKCITI